MKQKPVPSGSRPDIMCLSETFGTFRVTDLMRHAIITRVFRRINSDNNNLGRASKAHMGKWGGRYVTWRAGGYV
jgi:hypothetical protein